MASKEVLKIAGLKLTVEGAAQFQTSLKSINAQMKLSSAELQKVTAQYGKNSTATGALTTKKKALEDKLKSQRQVTTQLNSVLKETEQRYGENSEEATRMRAKVLESEAAEERLKTQLKAVTLELAKQSSKAVQLGNKLQTVGEKMNTFGQKASRVGTSMTKYMTVPILAAGVGAVKAAMDFETAFTGVRKTVDGTEEQLAALKQGILDMSSEVPASAEAIAAVAEAAGQLGIETDSILGFTKVMIDLGETTNLSSEEAATALAKFANITQMSQKDFDKLGSVIVDLGNNMATTEAEIVAMGMRLAGAGKQIGLTEPQIMGFAAALSSVGIEAEAGGSAFSKVMVKIQGATEKGGKGLKQFASVAGMSASEFKKKFETDASGAIIAFVEGLGKMGGEGKSAIGVLDEMGITEVRLRDALLRAAGAGDLLSEAITTGTDAWDDNNALTTEANKRYEDTASQMKIAWNEIKRMAMEFGNALLPVIRDVIKDVKPLVKWFTNLDETTKKNIIKAAAFVAAMGPVIKVVGKTSSAVGTLTKGVGKIIEKFGASRAAAAAASAGLGSVSSAATGAGTAAAGATTATAGLSGSMLGVLAPAGLLVGAAIAIGTAIDNATTTTDEFSREMTSAFENFAADVATANGVMEVFVSDTTASGKAVETVRDKINKVEGQIVSAYKAYMADKGAERDKDLADIREYNAELRELMLDEMSAYGTAQQVLADQLRLGTIEVTKENLAGVVKSIGEAETQAKDAADKIYEEQARYVLMNKDLTQEQKDDQLRKLAETRDEGKKIAKQMAADSAYYARLQMQSNDKNLAQRLKTVRNYGSKMTTAEKDFAREYQEISNRKYTDETQRSRDLQALGLRYAHSQQENAQLVSDAWLSVDEDTRAAWINLINAEAEGGRTLSTNTRQTVDALMRMYASMPGGLKNVGEDMMVALGRAIINEKSPERAANATKKDCVNAFKNAYGEYEEAGIKSMNKAAVGMKKGKPGVKTEAGKTKDAAVGEFRKLESAAESSGKSGIQGLIRGVRNPTLRNILYWAARALAQKANQGIKDGIQTGSPSKLWEKYGKWGAEGLVEGIKKEGNRVLKAATNLARKASTGVKDGLDLGELVSTYKEKFATIKTQLSDLKKSHADNLKAIKNTYKQTVETIKASREARAQQLGSFGGMFDAGEVKESASGEQMIANMRKNAKATIEYKNAFESLTKKNLPKEFMDQISELGIENTAQMQTLNSMTSKELAEYVRLWSIQQTNAAKAAKLQYQDEMKAAAAARDKAIEEENEAYEKQVKKLLVKYYDAMSELGKAISDGMTKGISTSRKNAIKAAGSLAKSVGNAIKDALKIASPSKVTMEFGKWTGRGFVDGLIAEEQHVTQAARNLASAANVGVVSGVEKPSVEKPKSAPANVEAMIERGIEKAMSRVTVELDKRQVGRLVVLREV